MSRTAAGVTIIATDGPAGRSGATVSSFSSLSLAPPSIVVCFQRDSVTLALLRANGVFCANVLAENQADIARVFARSSDRETRFSHDRWTKAASGAPKLAGALCRLDCRLAGATDYGSHVIVIGEALESRSSPGRPLIYSARNFHPLGEF